VQAIDKRGRPIGLAARKVVTTLLRCFTCNGRASNKECNRRNAVNCPLGTVRSRSAADGKSVKMVWIAVDFLKLI